MKQSISIVGPHELPPAHRSVAIGVFDGVHRGHQAVIRGADTVLSFDPHPLRILRPASSPRLLSNTDTKADRLSRLGIKTLVVIPFDFEWASMSAEQFVDDVLVGRLGAGEVRIGEDFRFGARGRGCATLLREDARFVTSVTPSLRVAGDVVSSTRIRALLAQGDVETAAMLLGRAHRIVVALAGPAPDGRTAYHLAPEQLLPAAGRYRATVSDGRARWPAAVRVTDAGVALRVPLLNRRAPARLSIDLHESLERR
jgi:riboflavin kinase/FMN adenylyltransferase